MLVIKNKRTQLEQVVSEEEWERINAHPATAGKWKIVMQKAESELIRAGKIKMIMPEEILSFKAKQVAQLKESKKVKNTKSK